MTTLNALASTILILSCTAYHADKEKQEDLALKEEVEELRKLDEDLKMRLDREKGLVQTRNKNNEVEICAHCHELIHEKKELQEQLDE